MKKCLFVILFLFNSQLFSQDLNRIWCFGDSAGIDFSDLSMPAPVYSYMDCAESCSSVGDSLNKLLMYTHTDYWPLWWMGSNRTTVVHNKYHELMLNGDSLIGNAFFNGLIIIPKPGNLNIFYLFQWGFNLDDGLYYSIVDPHFNNDSGRVIAKNIKFTSLDTLLEMGVFTIKHGNGRDWWIITRNGTNSNKFNLFLVTPYSIDGPFTQNIGTVTSTNNASCAVSKQGDKIALVNSDGLIETYTFDRCNGQISNATQIISNSSIYFAGCEFSSNGNLLYVSNTDNIFGDSLRLYQFDLTNPNPFSTKKIIYTEQVPASGGNLRRGPDDKIYFSCLYQTGWPYPDTCRNMYNENLSVINSPDSIGLACNFSPFSFYLGGKRTYWSLPNNPNNLLGPLTGSICDSLFINIPEVGNEKLISIYPNPTTGKVFIALNNKTRMNVKLYDSKLKLILVATIQSDLGSIDLSPFDNGVYFLKIDEDVCRKIVLLK